MKIKTIKRISLEEAQDYIPSKENWNNIFLHFYTIEPSIDLNYPSKEGWETVTYYTSRRKPKIKSLGKEIITSEGYIQLGNGPNSIYIMSNISMPGLLKIGSTRKSVEDRRKQLSSSSSVPEPFKTEWVFKLEGNEEFLEKEIHKCLEHKRNNMNREFFDISLFEAIEVIKKLGENYI